MKVALGLIVALMCFHGTSSFIFGANVAIPQLKDLSSAINKCSTAAQKFLPNLCEMVKTMLKFNTENFKEAANALTNVQFFFGDVLNFYNSVLNCLNDQNEMSTPEVAARVLGNLVFQIESYVINGASKLDDSSRPLGAIFGERVQKVIAKIAEQFKSEFETVKKSLETVTQDLLNIDVTVAVTAESLQQDLNATAISTMCTAFKDIATSSEQMATLTKDISNIIKTLGVTVNSAEKVEAISIESVTKANYQLDVTVQASKTLLEKNVEELSMLVTKSFNEFDNLTSTLFTGDKDIQESRTQVETFVITIRGAFTSASTKLTTSFSESFKAITTKISEMKETIAMMTTKVQTYLAESIAANSGSFIKCLGPSTNLSVQALQLIKEMGSNASTCITLQKTASLSAQSLMRFVIEDVVLNAKGASDKLCGCSVKGGKKDTEKTKKCIKKVTDDMGGQLATDEKNYIEGELTNIQFNVTTSTETFTMCNTNITTQFDEKFEKLKTDVSACMAI